MTSDSNKDKSSRPSDSEPSETDKPRSPSEQRPSAEKPDRPSPQVSRPDQTAMSQNTPPQASSASGSGDQRKPVQKTVTEKPSQDVSSQTPDAQEKQASVPRKPNPGTGQAPQSTPPQEPQSSLKVKIQDIDEDQGSETGQDDQNSKKAGTQNENWNLEANRVAIGSPLVETLRLMAGHFGRRTTSSALISGLPVPNEGITPSLFIRAAERADMHAALAERTLEALAISPHLPCILVLENNEACILWEIEQPSGKRFTADQQAPVSQGKKKQAAPEIQDGGSGPKDAQSQRAAKRVAQTAAQTTPQAAPQKSSQKEPQQLHPETLFHVQFPETEVERTPISFSDLQKAYTGFAFFLRPIARLDDRAGPAQIDNARDWFWGALKEHSRTYSEVIVAAVMINMFALASPLFIMNVYDRVIPNAAFETLWVLAIGVSLAFFFDFTLKNLRAHFLDVAGRKADIKISANLFEQVMGMTMAARPASAGVLANHMREFEGLRDFFTSATLVALIDLPFLFLFILLIFVIAGPIAFVPLAAVPIIVGTGLFLQKSIEKVIRDSMNENALKNAHLFETITGLETIKVQAAEGHSQRKWEELTDKSSRTAVKSRRISAFMMNFTVLIQQITSVVVVIVGVYLITEGVLTMGALIAAVILTGRVMAPLAQVAGLLTRLKQSQESLRQLDDLMKKEVERPMEKHFITKSNLMGRLEFKDVIFHYPNQTVPALNNVTFRINPGERVAIIGAVGSGKTTIERLILNLFQPDSGSVQVDGTDVRQIDPGDLRRNIGTVQQSPQLFYGSVRENITMGHETMSERAVLQAAEMSGVMEFLRDSELGLDTQVGERGESLSGGQRQAVAIARALLYDPGMMILDEPTASMDPASEQRLLKRLNKLCENKTTLMITHKAAMLGIVDKVMLLDRGKVVAFGPKDEIIKKLQAREFGTQAENTEV